MKRVALIGLAVLAVSCTSAPSRLEGADVHLAARSGSSVQLTAEPGSPVAASSAATDDLIAGEQRLAFALLNQAGKSDNVTVSPLSLAVALAMLENGAAGSTLREIQQVLSTPSLSAAQQDQAWASVMRSLAADAGAGAITLSSADSIWIDKAFQAKSHFLSALSTYFSSGIWQSDFQGQAAGATTDINRWVAQNTADKITAVIRPGQITSDTVMVLVNAIYMHALWAVPFDAGASAVGDFHVSPTSTTQPTFMYEQGEGAARPGYSIAILPYQGRKLEADVIMPTASSLTDFVGQLTPSGLDRMVSGIVGEAYIHLPKFTEQFRIDLRDPLSALGMKGAFTSAADFSALSTQPTQLQFAVQADYLRVYEAGTEAAASTAIGAESVAGVVPAPPDIHFDHPFLFVVRDKTTGAILFESEIRDPTA